MSETILKTESPNGPTESGATQGYCIFIDCVCGGMTPVWRDGGGKWVVYETKPEAFAEVMELYYDRFRQYLEGERDFEDLEQIEDVICKVTQLPDGAVVDAWGRVFPV